MKGIFKFLCTTIILLIVSQIVFANDIHDYLSQYRKSENSNVSTEADIINKYKFSNLVNDLKQYYTDTIPFIQKKAYYLIYKKSVSEKTEQQQIAVNILLNGCSRKANEVTGYNFDLLQMYSSTAFNNEAKQQIETLLNDIKTPHFKKLLMLAGFVNTGGNTIAAINDNQNVLPELKWYCSLALSRMGNPIYTEQIINEVKVLKTDNNFIEFIVPQLIYTKQKSTVDYCFQLIMSNEKQCFSSNPDVDKKILCGYRVMELVAPVIVDFPFEVDAMTQTLNTADYENALNTVREWYNNNYDYKIITTIF